MSITLAEFQLKAIADLMVSMQDDKRDIILKSCTGSGKTIILTHFMDEYLKSFAKIVFIWLTPGKGDLEEQSKKKMDKYIHNSQTKTLLDVMTGGFEENDVCFINWESLNKSSNNALKSTERTNFLEHIENALDAGLSFKIIIDESHEGDTIKGKEIIDYFKTDKIIRASATPKAYTDATRIEVPEAEVIAAELIKKVLVINEGVIKGDEVTDQIDYLLTKALQKHRKLYSSFSSHGSKVNPLNQAIKIMLWRVYKKTFSLICQYRYDYASKKKERTQLEKLGKTDEIAKLEAQFLREYDDIPNKTLNNYSLFGTMPAIQVDYDRIIYDTYDYMDKLIGFRLTDIFYAIFHQYYQNQTSKGDNRALRLAKYIRYGTDDERNIWMLRYGLTFEDIEWANSCIDSINEQEIIFNDKYDELTDEQKKIVERFKYPDFQQ